uniref:Si:dkey-112a7.4 n=1 Tax=Amphiprion percula TaxID=161767 RepID=A0A3P8TN10_AMPPE
MYGASGIPELIPPSGPPRQPGPAGQFNPCHPQVNGHGGAQNPQRLGQRAPKLGQIGRSKKDLDDEDLDDIMNNNGQCP